MQRVTTPKIRNATVSRCAILPNTHDQKLSTCWIVAHPSLEVTREIVHQRRPCLLRPSACTQFMYKRPIDPNDRALLLIMEARPNPACWESGRLIAYCC